MRHGAISLVVCSALMLLPVTTTGQTSHKSALPRGQADFDWQIGTWHTEPSLQESRDVWRFEQSYSADGGRTWELNWIAVDTRVGHGASLPGPVPSTRAPAQTFIR